MFPQDSYKLRLLKQDSYQCTQCYPCHWAQCKPLGPFQPSDHMPRGENSRMNLWQMGKNQHRFEGRPVCAGGDKSKACFTRKTELDVWWKFKVGMDTLYDNNTTILLHVVAQMDASMATRLWDMSYCREGTQPIFEQWTHSEVKRNACCREKANASWSAVEYLTAERGAGSDRTLEELILTAMLTLGTRCKALGNC